MVESARIDPARLITRRIPLEEAGAALEAMNHFQLSGVTVIDRF
jgi:threonine dehydrogenase-like Zn-dependent dehydrogenase